jgi:hypothetical protein
MKLITVDEYKSFLPSFGVILLNSRLLFGVKVGVRGDLSVSESHPVPT